MILIIGIIIGIPIGVAISMVGLFIIFGIINISVHDADIKDVKMTIDKYN